MSDIYLKIGHKFCMGMCKADTEKKNCNIHQSMRKHTC